MRPRRILFVDDEIYPVGTESSGDYMAYYLQSLKLAGFEVDAVDGPDKALCMLGTAAQYDLVLLDIMMPPETSLSQDDSRFGMRTGLLLVDRIADVRPTLPIVVLTNSNDRDVLAELRTKYTVKRILPKVENTPGDVVRVVETLFGVTR